MSESRIHWVDTAKGIAIFMVILGHTQCAPMFLRAIAVSCQIPLFFFLSGYTFRPKSFRLLLSSSARQLLVPWILISLYSLLINNPISCLQDLLSGLCFNLSWQVDSSLPAVGPAWFLFALCAARFIVNGLVRLSQRLCSPAILWFSVPCFAAVAVLLAISFDRLVPFGISQVLTAVSYLILGHLLRLSDVLDSKLRHMRSAVVPFCVIWGLCILASTIDVGSNLYSGFPAVAQIGSLVGIAVLIRASVLIDGHLSSASSCLAWVGVNSLGIYIVHCLDMALPWDDILTGSLKSAVIVGLLIFIARAGFDIAVYRSIASK